MRLLNTNTLKVEEFFSKVPSYAILSHTWGKEEVTLQDMRTDQAQQKAGYSKVRGCCIRAAQDGYDYVWIDTCCIDKTSSAELSEAINSMYKWYQQADICYAYLVDVSTVTEHTIYYEYWHNKHQEKKELRGPFRNSKWFTRGWTLQELIAPRIVEFYAADWTEIGTRVSLQDEISIITGIDNRILDGESPDICNVAERFSWAASRETSRVEDAAYCLLGIFQVHMPLLYGESENALLRLQEQILKTTEDYTLLARRTSFHSPLDSGFIRFQGALAQHLREFNLEEETTWKDKEEIQLKYSELELDTDATTETILRKNSKELVADISPTLTAKGLHLRLPLLIISNVECLAYLNCRLRKTGELMCMRLLRISLETDRFRRSSRLTYRFLPPEKLSEFSLVAIFIRHEQQQQHLPRQFLGARDFYEHWFEVNSTLVSDTCSIQTSWGSETTVLPWKTQMGGMEHSHPLPPNAAALFNLKYGYSFMVRFGIKSGRHWCCVIPEEDLCLPSHKLKGNWHQYWNEWPSFNKREPFIPDVLVDRATKVLPSNHGMIFVSIRKVLNRLVVSVLIKGAMP